MKKRIVLLIALGALPLLLNACGGGGTKAEASSATSADGASGAAGASGDNAAFRECLSEHGVTLPDGFGDRPGGGQGGPGANGTPPDGSFPNPGENGGPPQGGFPGGDNPEFQKAMEACRSKLPAGDRGGFGGQNAQAFQAYTSCLKDHGVTVPTGPSGATGSAGPGGLRNLQSDPKFQEANKTCQALLPARSGGNGGTSTTVGS